MCKPEGAHNILPLNLKGFKCFIKMNNYLFTQLLNFDMKEINCWWERQNFS